MEESQIMDVEPNTELSKTEWSIASKGNDEIDSKVEHMEEYQFMEEVPNIQFSKTEDLILSKRNCQNYNGVDHIDAYQVRGGVKRKYECIHKKSKIYFNEPKTQKVIVEALEDFTGKELNEAEQKSAMKLQEEIQKILELREKEERIKLLESNPNDPDNPLNSRIPYILELIPDSGSNSIYLPGVMKEAYITKESLTTLIDKVFLNDEVIDSYNICFPRSCQL